MGHTTGYINEAATLSAEPSVVAPETVAALGLHLSVLTLRAGGLAGSIDAYTRIELCAAVVNDLSAAEWQTGANPYPQHHLLSGNLIGEKGGTVLRVAVASKTDQNYYKKYSIESWFGDQTDTRAEFNYSVLNDYLSGGVLVLRNVDEQGLVFDSAVDEDGALVTERTLISYVETLSEAVTVPEYVFGGRFLCAVTAIGSKALANSGVQTLTVGESVAVIGDEAFRGCDSLTEARLGDGVVQVGSKILAECNALERLEIGRSLTRIPEIGTSAAPFGINKEQSRLEAYAVDEENPAFGSDENGVLYEEFSITNTDGSVGEKLHVAILDVPVNATVSAYTPPTYIVRIYPGAFSYNRTLTKIKLDYIRDIGERAFMGARKLTEVQFGELSEDESGTITILDEQYPKATESYSQIVGINAFKDCVSLQTVNLESATLRKIGSGAFENCATAEGAAALRITLGPNIETINASESELNSPFTTDEYAVKDFAGVFNGARVASFAVAESNTRFLAMDGVLYFRPGLSVNETEVLWLVAYPSVRAEERFTVPAPEGFTVTRISKSAFAGAEHLRMLTVSGGVEVVDNFAFQNAKVYSITFGPTVRDIGTTDYGRSEMFVGCGNLTGLYVDPANPYYSDWNGEGILFNKSETELIKYPAAKAGKELTLPATLTKVWDNAFTDNNMLRRVTFESEISQVGRAAFAHCENLSIVYFKIGEAPYMGTGAFETDNPRTIVAYGADVESWNRIAGEYTNSDGKKLYTIEKFSGFTDEKASTGYYAFVVNDKNGNRLNHIYVQITANTTAEGESAPFSETIKTQYGIAMFYDLSYDTSYTLRVVDNEGEYFPQENVEFSLDPLTKTTYITLSSIPTVSGVNVSYELLSNEKIKDILGLNTDDVFGQTGTKTADINSETVKINKALIDSLTLRVSCGLDLDAAVVAYHLVQGDTILKTFDDPTLIATLNDSATLCGNGKKTLQIAISIDTSVLESEQDVYAVVEFLSVRNGREIRDQVQAKLNVHVFEFTFGNLDLSWLFGGLSVPVPALLQDILGMQDELELFAALDEEGKKKLQFKYVVTEDAYRVAIAYNRELKDWGFDKNQSGDDSETPFEDTLNNWESFVSNNKNQGKKFGVFETNSSGSVEFTLSGYLEYKYKGLTEDGKPDFQIESGISGYLTVSHDFGTTIQFWVIPIRLEASLSLTGELTFSLVFDKEAAQFVTPNLQFTIEGSIELSAGIGFACASAGVYGNVTSIFVLDLVPSIEVESWTLEPDVGFYVKYDGLFVKFKKTISLLDILGVDAEWVIYADGKWWNEKEGTEIGASSTLSLNQALVNEENYVLAASSFDPVNASFGLAGIENKDTDAYSGIAPRTVQVGDLIYVIYHEDLNGYSDSYDSYNYQKLVYQTYNTVTGEYSEVFVLDDNGYADGAFEVWSDGTDAVIVYTQLNKKLTSDQAEDMEAYVGSMEVRTAVLGADGRFTLTEALTSDSFYDMHLRVGTVSGTLVAAWVRNEENTMFGTTRNGNMSVWYSVYENGAWSAATLLAGGLGTVTDLEVGNMGIAYILDGNNDLTTVTGADGSAVTGYSDRTLTVIGLDGSILYRTAAEQAYHDVSNIDGDFAYYLENNLYRIDPVALSAAALLDGAVSELTDDYTVLRDAEGNAKAILFVSTVSYGEDEEGSNLFGIFREGDAWGRPIQLTDLGAGTFVSAFDALDGGTGMTLSALLTTDLLYAATEDENADAYTASNEFRTEWIPYPTDYEASEPTFDYGAIRPNTEGTLTVTVTNQGYETLTSIPVSVSLGNTVLYQATLTVFYDEAGNVIPGIGSGQSGTLRLTFNSGGVTEERYTVMVGEQSYETQLWYSDFTVYGKQVLIGDTYHIIAYVANEGYLPGAYDLKVELTDAEGTREIFRTRTETLAFGEQQYFEIPLENRLGGEGSALAVVTAEADGEYMIANNASKVNVATEEEQADLDLENLVGLSVTTAKVDQTAPADIAVEFKSSYELISITLNDTVHTAGGDLFVLEGSRAILNGAYLSSFPCGELELHFTFKDGTDTKEALMVVTVVTSFTVTWSVNGAETTETYENGTMPVHDTPEKEGNAERYYVFLGWDSDGDEQADALTPVSGNITYTALFAEALNEYTLTWVTPEGSTEETYHYGDIPSFGETPVKAPDKQYEYRFAGWDTDGDGLADVPAPVTANLTYTALFEASPRTYTVTLIVGEQRTELQVAYGTVPAPGTPAKAADAQYHYSFRQWSPALSPVYGNQEYTAVFDKSLREYTVTWMIDGTAHTAQTPYGTIPVFAEGTPQKPATDRYSYTFISWDREITPVTADAVYTARFEETVNQYSVTWSIHGKQITEEYDYGAIPVCPADTGRASDETYRYTFSGWDKEIGAVTGDTVYTAQYTATLRGNATVTGTAFETAWGKEFRTTLSLTEMQNMTTAKLMIHYDTTLVTLVSQEALAGVTVTDLGDGNLSITVEGMARSASMELLTLCFRTGENAPVGESAFLAVDGEALLTDALPRLVIHRQGDANMDGRVNVRDLNLVRQEMLAPGTLNEIQLVYANVTGDTDEDGNAVISVRDLNLIRQYMLQLTDDIGDRITVTLVYGEDDVRTLSLVAGSVLEGTGILPDGYAWSYSPDTLEAVAFEDLTEDITLYLVPINS